MTLTLSEWVAREEAKERAKSPKERPTKMICRRCKLNIRICGEKDGSSIWKHHASGTTTKSCGKPPQPFKLLLLSKEDEAEIRASAKHIADTV